jgi:hypothetical protein
MVRWRPKRELKAYRDMPQTTRDRVAAQIAAGKTLEEASGPTRASSTYSMRPTAGSAMGL